MNDSIKLGNNAVVGAIGHKSIGEVKINEPNITSKTIFDYICSWYGGIIGGTASILGAWWFAWKEWGIWFFGL